MITGEEKLDGGTLLRFLNFAIPCEALETVGNYHTCARLQLKLSTEV